MLKVKMQNGDCKLIAGGNVAEILTDVSMVIALIYEKLDDGAKGFYEEALKEYVGDGLFKMSEEEWDAFNGKKAEEIKKKVEKEKSEVKEELKKSLKELLEKLDGLGK